MFQSAVHQHQVTTRRLKRSEIGVRCSRCPGKLFKGKARSATATAVRVVASDEPLADWLPMRPTSHPQAAIGLVCIFQCKPDAKTSWGVRVKKCRVLVPIDTRGEGRREAVQGLHHSGPAPPELRHDARQVRRPHKVPEGSLPEMEAVRDLPDGALLGHAWPESAHSP
eukprot:CAMPEP_0204569616 /NCGR_PEP_ID=MMETSP0661-20131031/37846_1 /ASSEMBLY_ACC=CAM_ASM_000606 /TAXON_ID=109239 /ORGANISM="Alexandrium margalefi, Strain AMGDE01CS-322" /LENGTH=167 /DNA_ID=CAMNT_0051577733 /DNA_START=344 /DNA_END=843 /DNA_ORIENTATION=+